LTREEHERYLEAVLEIRAFRVKDKAGDVHASPACEVLTLSLYRCTMRKL
jgi:hypothetical protein